MKDIAALFKVRLGFFVVMSAILGWFMAVETLDLKSFLLLTIGGYLLTGASNGLNQVIEKRVDGLMERTAERPLPAGRMPGTARSTRTSHLCCPPSSTRRRTLVTSRWR